jgi:Flp pilus assembly protein TadG
MAALLLPLMMAFAAFAIDIGSVYAHRRALQNASDAAALAGAREALQLQLGSTTANPKAKALDFAKRNGIEMPGSVCQSDGKATLSSNQAGTNPQTWSVTTSRKVSLTFGSFVGTPSQCVQASAEAKASTDMLDIMLSLDTTGSMELSGTEDFEQLRDAVVEFIKQVNPDPANPRSPKLGMARFAGIKCRYSGSNYVNPCDNDQTLLSELTTNKANLIKLTSGNQSGCPTGPGGASVKEWACELRHAPYDAPGDGRTDEPYYTGTKLPNAFFALNNNSSTWSTVNNAWSTNRGGRADARKIMVLFTDGRNEEHPSGPQSATAWDSEARTMANMFKAQGVEIYSVGFFCAPYSDSFFPPKAYCKSRLVDAPSPVCPGPWPPTVAYSPIDELLKDLSSSSDRTCDHYYPLKKTDDLPELFRTLAARFMAVRLTS